VAHVLDGHWVPIDAEMDGMKLPQGILEGTRLEIQGEKYDALVGGTSDQGMLRLDTSERPMLMDITGVEGPNAGRNIPAIYELEGNRLRICYALAGPPRPRRFETAEGTQHFLVTYRRSNP
jgi:uncharacterized protein (TIGR03067 family)